MTEWFTTFFDSIAAGHADQLVLYNVDSDEQLPITTHLADMRLFDVGSVDAAYTLANSLSYLDIAGISRFFDCVARAVVPGGRYVVDSSMVAECVLAHFEPESSYSAAGITMSDQHRYDAGTAAWTRQ
ncbi:MAG: hypothetical protein JO148_15875 [Acidimicrobiia bacterium]|nr:hypothetical protein [Acidimicrobiia bacterium]